MASAYPYHVRNVVRGGIDAVELRDERSGAFAVFARRGATLLDWCVPHAGEMVALTDGYVSAEDLAGQNGVRNGILAPFPNCIADGLIRCRLRDPATGRQLTIWQRGGLIHVFTGDTLARDPRRSIAIEPVEVMTNSFNRPDCETLIRLAPGATRSFACGAEFDVESDPSTPFAVVTA
jgi:galactose mutarotase-like enzyme